MGEMAGVLRMLSSGLPTAIQQVNYPVHKGQPNPAHGKFYFVGSIPFDCSEPDTHGTPQYPPRRKSKYYDTEQAAIDAAKAAGATRIQRCNCSFVD